jgi:hypothetical protein
MLPGGVRRLPGTDDGHLPRFGCHGQISTASRAARAPDMRVRIATSVLVRNKTRH